MPADTFSATLGSLVMGTGNDNNTWGNNANVQVFAILEAAIAGLTAYAVVGGTQDLSGTPPPAGPTQALPAILTYSGILAADEVVKVPNISKWWIVNNTTTGAFKVTFQTPSGTPVAVPQGGWAIVWCDGANTINVGVLGPILSNGVINWVVAGGAADAITATYNPPLTALVDGQLVFFRATAANATTTPTFSPNGLTARVITKFGGAALALSDIPGALGEVILRYNLANTRWELLNPSTAAVAPLSVGTSAIIPGNVTYSRIQNEANNTFLGNVAGGSGPPQEITFGSGFSITGTTGGAATFNLTGGTGYTNGTYNNVPLTGGTGAGAQAFIVVSGGAVTIVVITVKGTGYGVGNNLTAAGIGPGVGFNLQLTGVLINPTASVGGLAPTGSYKNKKILVVSNTTANVTADELVVSDGTNKATIAINSTGGNVLNVGSSGAANRLDTSSVAIDTWYAIWGIAQPGGLNPAVVASTSFTAPNLAWGTYTMFGYLGALQTIHASAIFYGMQQVGRRGSYIAGLGGGKPEQTAIPGPITNIASGTLGNSDLTNPTLIATQVRGNGKFVPPTASVIYITASTIFNSGGPNTVFLVAPSQAYSGANNGPRGTNKLMSTFYINSVDNILANFDILLESDNISIASSGSAGVLVCQGWDEAAIT